jgi:histidinol-phosphatase
MTLVSDADKAVEETLRQRISQARPAHAVMGEEFGAAGQGEWRWIIDPIDGTHNYVRGVPIFATLLALEHTGDLQVGVVSAPALGRRWWAAKGEGAFVNGKPIHVSRVSRLGDAHLSTDSEVTFEPFGLGPQFLDLSRRCWRTRGFGDFWSHVLVAEGAVDIAIEPEVRLWDLAALQVIVEEAGGRLTDFTGTARADGGNVVSTNGLLHDEVLAILRVGLPGAC